MGEQIRVLYSFPHKLGAARICTTAWHQVTSLALLGTDVLACPGAVYRTVPARVTVRPTLAFGKLRIPYSVLGRLRAFALHDYIVAKRIEKLRNAIDIVHTWPLGALRTLKAAAALGIPTVLERPNAHTRFAYEVVQRECEHLGVFMPSGHEHAFNQEVLRIEEMEYRLATKILCPSDFVAQTFLDKGFHAEQLARHQYGYDETVYFPDLGRRAPGPGLTVLFAGGCAPRKGLHYALQAWLQSSAHIQGTFLIAGSFIPGYGERLSKELSHPSVRVLGYRADLPELMRQSDILALPSIEEGSALVTSEARGSGCVLLVSHAAGAICQHGVNALIHSPGDVDSLRKHFTVLHEDRGLLQRLRAASLQSVNEITWTAAGAKLRQVYRNTIEPNAHHAAVSSNVTDQAH
jgi:glycosyltransferase involved in cell wall biosynthesis